MVKLPLFKAEFEIQREIKKACPPSLSGRALENLYECNLVKLETNCTVMLPPTVSVIGIDI